MGEDKCPSALVDTLVEVSSNDLEFECRCSEPVACIDGDDGLVLVTWSVGDIGYVVMKSMTDLDEMPYELSGDLWYRQ